MKLKKKHFKRLKEIAMDVNQIVPGTGSRLDKLIADIESVQKVKSIVGKPLNPLELALKKACDKHRKAVEENIATEYGWNNNPLGVDTKEVELIDLDEPKIGDYGYFWNTATETRYGRIRDISSSPFQGENHTVFRIDRSETCEFYANFSKTPPELK